MPTVYKDLGAGAGAVTGEAGQTIKSCPVVLFSYFCNFGLVLFSCQVLFLCKFVKHI